MLNNKKSLNETKILKFYINSGEGGLDSQDFAKILKEMYSKWFKKQNINFEIFENKQNDAFFGVEFHIKKFNTELIEKLNYENGKHKLIRNSPFNKQKSRETSFCYVKTILSNLFVNINDDILNKEVRIDKMRASGAGGQHVNKTESAIRVTHLPTGIQAICQDGRNQHENKKSAIENLKSKLLKLQKEQQLKQDFDFVSSALQDLDRSNKNRTYNWKDDRIVNHLVDQKFPLKRVFSDKKNFFDFLVKNLIEYERVFFTELKLEYLKERCSEC